VPGCAAATHKHAKALPPAVWNRYRDNLSSIDIFRQPDDALVVNNGVAMHLWLGLCGRGEGVAVEKLFLIDALVDSRPVNRIALSPNFEFMFYQKNT
jgi:hypothetical protein